jgi:hypothetical protein
MNEQESMQLSERLYVAVHRAVEAHGWDGDELPEAIEDALTSLMEAVEDFVDHQG